MTPWWLLMLGGLTGSSHCVGMCGGFAAIVGLKTGSLSGNLRAQGIYSAGRLMSYATLGAVAGSSGRWFSESLPRAIPVPAVLCLIAGLLLLHEGLAAAGILRRGVPGASTGGCLLGPMFSTILRAPGAAHTFLAGMATGLLPCGLVYAFVSLAASSGDLLRGTGTMLAFGLGTVPLMVAAGCGAALLGRTARQRLWQVAAWSVVATGLLTLGRGIAFLRSPVDSPEPGCPFCVQAPAAEEPSFDRFGSR